MDGTFRRVAFIDTRTILYLSREDPSDKSFGVHLFTLDALRLGIVSWVPAPDGRFLLNLPVGDTTPPPITVIVNWLAALKK